MAEHKTNQDPGSCTHDCNTCGTDCPARSMTKADFLAPQNKHSDVKKVIGVVSGKGGVGKSLVTSLMAVAARRKGLSSAILDADVTGPSIPKLFGIHSKAFSTEEAILPVYSDGGTGIMSVNLILGDEKDPVIWRGPVIAGVVKQFWTDVAWSDQDIMFVDMPPGTGDVPLTVFQSLPLDGIIVVTSPQDLVSMVVEKAVRMAEKMDIPVLGIVENMSYFECPDCGKKHRIFGESKTAEIAKAHDIPVTIEIPIRPEIASMCDEGKIEEVPDNLTALFSDLL